MSLLKLIGLFYLGFLLILSGLSVYVHHHAVLGLLTVCVGITFGCASITFRISEEVD